MSENAIPPRGTSAHRPDLSWSQVRETVLMLELAAVQIETAMRDSDASVDILAESFTAMADSMASIGEGLRSLPDEGPTGAIKARLGDISSQVSERVRQAIIAFQFYDKLVQRLSHVGLSLGELSDLVGDGGRLYNPGEWVGLQQRIRSKYTTREEVAMFDAVMDGVPVQLAVERYLAELRSRDDDIELF